MIEQIWRKKKTERMTVDVQYGLDCAQAYTSQLGAREGSVQKDFDCNLRQAGRLKAGMNRIRDHLVENLQPGRHNYVRTAFAALKAPTSTYCDGLRRSLHVSVSIINDGIMALFETVEGICGPFCNAG